MRSRPRCPRTNAARTARLGSPATSRDAQDATQDGPARAGAPVVVPVRRAAPFLPSDPQPPRDDFGTGRRDWRSSERPLDHSGAFRAGQRWGTRRQRAAGNSATAATRQRQRAKPDARGRRGRGRSEFATRPTPGAPRSRRNSIQIPAPPRVPRLVVSLGKDSPQPVKLGNCEHVRCQDRQVRARLHPATGRELLDFAPGGYAQSSLDARERRHMRARACEALAVVRARRKPIAVRRSVPCTVAWAARGKYTGGCRVFVEVAPRRAKSDRRRPPSPAFRRPPPAGPGRKVGLSHGC